MKTRNSEINRENENFLDKIIRLCLENQLIVFLLLVSIVLWGLLVAPFDWHLPGIARSPVPVDAIPDIGENQQIVFTKWMGRSPQDVEDQITYPLTVSLLGIPGVKTIRSNSMFGFSSIYIIFKDNVDFYWSRSRILEKLNSLPPNSLPEGVKPSLGPDATALGQIFWYTLEGRDTQGNPTGGWSLDELRSIQDWYVRYGLQSAEGVAEVASIGGYVKEYQINVDPVALQQNNVTLTDVFQAVKLSNLDVGARTIEVNRVEYIVRGIGFIKNLQDIRFTVVKTVNNTPIYIKDIAQVAFGPAQRRGALDKEGAEAVGGVVVVRYGENPLAAINNVKEKIKEISPGLPQKQLPDGRTTRVTIVPFYDRSELIQETLGTLNNALRDEILITVIVILIMIMHFTASVLITSLLPLTVLMVFIGMKLFGVDANIVALSGIAIAIGTIVDMGIVVSENILRHLEENKENPKKLKLIHQATSEVGGAVLTAVSTTIVSFLPVFTMVAAEGKLFKPLAYTKTLALICSIIITLTILPPFASLLFTKKINKAEYRKLIDVGIIVTGLISIFIVKWWFGLLVLLFGIFQILKPRLHTKIIKTSPTVLNWIVIIVVTVILATTWSPLGRDRPVVLNFVFVSLIISVVMGALMLFTKYYPSLLSWALDHKKITLAGPALLLILGMFIWMGFGRIFGFMPHIIKRTAVYQKLNNTFPGLGREFMPPLDEGSYLYMPTTMAHAGMEEALDVLHKLDRALYSVPEVKHVVGKIGRVDSPLDPAPISMVETIVTYKSEYITDQNGNRIKFALNDKGEFIRDAEGKLVPDKKGKLYRQWREHIRTAEDIWDELVRAARIPGTTSAPRLQPISARIVMLQSGMRAPMGIKVKGPDLKTIERVGLELEKLLKEVPSINPESVIADRIVGKPYLEIEIDRRAIARYGVSVQQVQNIIEVALGGKQITSTIEGRERYPVRVRYMRELRDDFEKIGNTLIPIKGGAQIPLKQLADITYVRGPQMIKSEDTFLTGYVLFDKKEGRAEVEVVEQAKSYLQTKIEKNELIIPKGVSYAFAGSYQNQIRAAQKLRIILPLALLIIFLILYVQFHKVSTTLIVFSGIFVAWAGGFVIIWLYGQEWFLNFTFMGIDMRTLFQIKTINLSVAVWVGFLALFGIASDNGVLISTYLDQNFSKTKPSTIKQIRAATLQAGKRRIRPAMMTASTTILALIPILTSTGRGSDVMVPMAIPSFGGMVFAILTTFVVPTLYAMLAEHKIKRQKREKTKRTDKQ